MPKLMYLPMDEEIAPEEHTHKLGAEALAALAVAKTKGAAYKAIPGVDAKLAKEVQLAIVDFLSLAFPVDAGGASGGQKAGG